MTPHYKIVEIGGKELVIFYPQFKGDDGYKIIDKDNRFPIELKNHAEYTSFLETLVEREQELKDGLTTLADLVEEMNVLAKGPKGDTRFMWVKYADDAEGNGMSDNPDGKKFIGMAFNKDVEKPSDEPSDYKFVKYVADYDGLEIGGRNLLRNSEEEHVKDSSVNSLTYLEIVDGLLSGEEYTLSFEAKSTNGTDNFYISTNVRRGSTYQRIFDKLPSEKYARYSYTLVAKNRSENVIEIMINNRISNNPNNTGYLYIKKLKLEKGNKATDWSPAPEDVFNDASYHRMGIFENGNIEDPEELLWATWNELQEQKRPFENYTLDVLLYAEKAGLDHEKVRLGDTTIALDRRFARPIEVEERIIAYEYDVANPDDTGKVELGQFRELFSDEKRLDKMQEQLDNAQGKANHPEIDDDSFPDVKPDTPDNFTAEGLFKVIQLKWDFNASSYIASYELYASQTPNFNPTPETLVWRGKTGGYAFEADTDEQWYFRLRAVNTHGTASDFTSEISAQTTKINAGIDVAPYTITDQLIAQDANIDGAKIGDATITSAKISNLIGDLITAGIIKDANEDR